MPAFSQYTIMNEDEDAKMPGWMLLRYLVNATDMLVMIMQICTERC